MKILIAADMEGITGVVNWDQVSPGHAEYERFRRIMTDEVNAAARGAFDAGADEVIITDGHAGGNNILIEALDPRARLNMGNGLPFSMAQGIQDGVDGVFFVGYHARAGSQDAILDHTWSSKCVVNLWLNGVLVGEYGLNAALCGHFGAPVLLISGDQTACAQACELLGPIETVVVKQATGRMSAECLPPQAAQERLYQAAIRAVRRLRDNQAPVPFHVSLPVRVAIELANSEMADNASQLPGVIRLDGRRIEFSADDMPTAFRSFQAAVGLARG